MSNLMMTIMVSFMFLMGCTSSPIVVTHAEGVGSIALSIGGEVVDISIDVDHEEGLTCQTYSLAYDGYLIAGYAPDSPDLCGQSHSFEFDWIRLVNPVLRIITRFF